MPAIGQAAASRASSSAERSDATEVVAALNALFEVMVPIVTDHGGHVDKFLGDGLLAVFGAPEGYADHADRAVAAGLDLVRAVNRPGAELEIGVGINTGPVVAGSIGGAGRLNFSVIGDAVNVSARVEAATRDLDHDLLITRDTCDALYTWEPNRSARPMTSRQTASRSGEPSEKCAAVDGFARRRAHGIWMWRERAGGLVSTVTIVARQMLAQLLGEERTD